MRHMFVAVTLCGLVACGGNENTPTGPTPPPASSQRFTLTGTVTDSGTATPIAEAAIAITDGPNAGRSATSDSNGHYSLADLQLSGFTIRTTRDGYREASQGVTLTSNTTANVMLTRLLTGSWRGTLALTVNGGRVVGALSNASLIESGNRLDGVLTVANGASATFTGSIDAGRFSGTLRLDTTSSDPNQRCTGTADNFTGPTTSTSITLTAPTLRLDSCAGTITDAELRLTR